MRLKNYFGAARNSSQKIVFSFGLFSIPEQVQRRTKQNWKMKGRNRTVFIPKPYGLAPGFSRLFSLLFQDCRCCQISNQKFQCCSAAVFLFQFVIVDLGLTIDLHVGS